MRQRVGIDKKYEVRRHKPSLIKITELTIY